MVTYILSFGQLTKCNQKLFNLTQIKCDWKDIVSTLSNVLCGLTVFNRVLSILFAL